MVRIVSCIKSRFVEKINYYKEIRYVAHNTTIVNHLTFLFLRHACESLAKAQ